MKNQAKEPSGTASSKNSNVLVGTCKGNRLTDRRGWCSYPIPDEDLAAKDAKREGRAPSRPQPSADLSTLQPFNSSTRPNGTHYALFRTQFLYRHKGEVPGDAERVFIRAADFAATLAADQPGTNVINEDMCGFKEAA